VVDGKIHIFFLELNFDSSSIKIRFLLIFAIKIVLTVFSTDQWLYTFSERN
ncbi:MAG: hypothetical protein ACJA08_003524, partial [Cyclobacteriaceae bacterium]